MENFCLFDFLKDSAEIFQGLHISRDFFCYLFLRGQKQGWFCILNKFSSHDIYCYFICTVFCYYLHFLCIIYMFFIARMALWNKCPVVNASENINIPQINSLNRNNFFVKRIELWLYWRRFHLLQRFFKSYVLL